MGARPYIISGFFYIKFERGTYQGWTQANLYEVDTSSNVFTSPHFISAIPAWKLNGCALKPSP